MVKGVGGREEQTKLGNCDSVCKPKDRGGLGIKKITDLNNALLTKVGCKLLKDEANWCKIL